MAAWTERPGVGARSALLAAIDGSRINGEMANNHVESEHETGKLTLIRWTVSLTWIVRFQYTDTGYCSKKLTPTSGWLDRFWPIVRVEGQPRNVCLAVAQGHWAIV